jgi:hypothetical protein
LGRHSELLYDWGILEQTNEREEYDNYGGNFNAVQLDERYPDQNKGPQKLLE